MNILPSPGLVVLLPLAMAAGIALGIAFFATLHRNVELYADGRPAAAGLLQLLRFALLVAVLAGAVHFGAGPLLACSLGLLAGRYWVMRRVKGQP